LHRFPIQNVSFPIRLQGARNNLRAGQKSAQQAIKGSCDLASIGRQVIGNTKKSCKRG
jgi:hypothetical protein